MNYGVRRRSRRWGSARLLLGVLLFVAAGTSLGWAMSRRHAARLEERALALEQQLAALKADDRVDEVAAYQLPAAPQNLVAWQAYVLLHQAEALWRGAYESWLAGDWCVADGRSTGDAQAGASKGEVSFPSRDELLSLKVVESSGTGQTRALAQAQAQAQTQTRARTQALRPPPAGREPWSRSGPGAMYQPMNGRAGPTSVT